METHKGIGTQTKAADFPPCADRRKVGFSAFAVYRHKGYQTEKNRPPAAIAPGGLFAFFWLVIIGTSKRGPA